MVFFSDGGIEERAEHVTSDVSPDFSLRKLVRKHIFHFSLEHNFRVFAFGASLAVVLIVAELCSLLSEVVANTELVVAQVKGVGVRNICSIKLSFQVCSLGDEVGGTS